MGYIEVSMNPIRRALRPLTLIIGVLHLAVSEAASMHQATIAPPSRTSVAGVVAGGAPGSTVAPGTNESSPAHDSSTCPACQTLRTAAWSIEPARSELPAIESGTSFDPPVQPSRRQVPRHARLSRAPPALPG